MSILRVVDFPEPFGPKRPKDSPVPIVKLRLLTLLSRCNVFNIFYFNGIGSVHVYSATLQNRKASVFKANAYFALLNKCTLLKQCKNKKEKNWIQNFYLKLSSKLIGTASPKTAELGKSSAPSRIQC